MLVTLLWVLGHWACLSADGEDTDKGEGDDESHDREDEDDGEDGDDGEDEDEDEREDGEDDDEDEDEEDDGRGPSKRKKASHDYGGGVIGATGAAGTARAAPKRKMTNTTSPPSLTKRPRSKHGQPTSKSGEGIVKYCCVCGPLVV